MSLRRTAWLSVTGLVFVAFLAATASAQTLYKYRGDDGEWIYSDRPPDEGEAQEDRESRSRHVVGPVGCWTVVLVKAGGFALWKYGVSLVSGTPSGLRLGRRCAT